MKILKVYEYWWSMWHARILIDFYADLICIGIINVPGLLLFTTMIRNTMHLMGAWIGIGIITVIFPLVLSLGNTFVRSWWRVFGGAGLFNIIMNINKRCIVFTDWNSVEIVGPSMSVWFKENCAGKYYRFDNKFYRNSMGVIVSSNDDMMRFKMVYC